MKIVTDIVKKLYVSLITKKKKNQLGIPREI